MSQKAVFQRAEIWIVGDAPLIVHSWSEKAKHEMLQKQVKAIKPGKAPRTPEQEFTDSLYRDADQGRQRRLWLSLHRSKKVHAFGRAQG